MDDNAPAKLMITKNMILENMVMFPVSQLILFEGVAYLGGEQLQLSGR